MIIKLSHSQYIVIRDLFNLEDDKIPTIMDDQNKLKSLELFNATKLNVKIYEDNSRYYIDSDENTIRRIRDMFGSYLMISNSFDIDYNPTRLGRTVESLIDLFNI
jgi:hypothetical protein